MRITTQTQKQNKMTRSINIDEIRRTEARPIDLIVLHCSATRSQHEYTPAQMLQDHLTQGFDGIGYHFYIRRNGSLYATRPLDLPGAHARGYNYISIGICYEGGLDSKGQPCDTRTPQQRSMLRRLVAHLISQYDPQVVGHHDLNPDKACPCFDVQTLFTGVQ